MFTWYINQLPPNISTQKHNIFTCKWTQGAGNVWVLLIHVKHASHNTGVCLHIGKTHLCVSIFQCQGKMVVSNTGPPSIYLNSQKPRFCDILLAKYCWDVLLCGCKGVLGFCLFPQCINMSRKKAKMCYTGKHVPKSEKNVNRNHSDKRF